MGLCPSQCTDTALVALPASECTVTVRRTSISRIVFMSCSTDLPSPIDCTNIAPIIAANDIVFSAPLADVSLDDPTTEDLVLNDCEPARKLTTGRVLNFSDKNAISQTSGSPAVVNAYYDYDFWKDKLAKRERMRYGLAFCNGDVKMARDEDGNLLTASLQTFLAFQKLGTTGAAGVEFKKGVLTFNGDPLSSLTAPDFNLEDCGINI